MTSTMGRGFRFCAGGFCPACVGGAKSKDEFAGDDLEISSATESPIGWAGFLNFHATPITRRSRTTALIERTSTSQVNQT